MIHLGSEIGLLFDLGDGIDAERSHRHYLHETVIVDRWISVGVNVLTIVGAKLIQ